MYMIDTKGVKFVNGLSQLIDKRIKEYKRKGEHASQARIAIDLGIDPATLSLYKNNRVKSLDIELLKRMVQYFGVPSDKIFHIDFVEDFAPVADSTDGKKSRNARSKPTNDPIDYLDK